MEKGQMFMVYFTSFILFQLSQRCTALQCHQCDSIDHTTCEATQVTETCRSRNPVCMTQAFTITYDDGNRKYFKKGCVSDINECSRKCKTIPDDVDNCQIICCKTKFCNNNDPANKKLVYRNKKKRSSVQSNISIRSNGNFIFVMVLSMLPFVIKSIFARNDDDYNILL